MAKKACRSGMRGRPPLGLGGSSGSRGSTAIQSASLGRKFGSMLNWCIRDLVVREFGVLGDPQITLPRGFRIGSK